MTKLKSISIKVERGTRPTYQDWEPYEKRDIKAAMSIESECVVFGEKHYFTSEVTGKLPKDLEDKFVELWDEVKKRLE